MLAGGSYRLIVLNWLLLVHVPVSSAVISATKMHPFCPRHDSLYCRLVKHSVLYLLTYSPTNLSSLVSFVIAPFSLSSVVCYKSRESRKLQFADGRLQISNRANSLRKFLARILYFLKNFFDKKIWHVKFDDRTRQLLLLPRRHCCMSAQ